MQLIVAEKNTISPQPPCRPGGGQQCLFLRFISLFVQTTLCDIAQELCELQQSGTVPHSKLLW